MGIKNKSFHFSIEKHIRDLSILLILLIGMFSCSKNRSNEELASLYYLLLQNPGDESAVSIVEIEVRDVASYDGKCLDQFIGITAGSYFNVQYPPEVRDLPNRKVVISGETCSRLGFSGGVENRLDGRAVSFRSYFCNAQTSLCSSRAISTAGF